MKNVFLKITQNIQVGKDIYLMRLEGDLSDIKNPGEFVEVKLKDYYLITYRFNQGKFIGRGVHGHNVMGCLLKKEDMLETNRDNIQSRIFPIDYDRNINSNCGYTGVVEFDDGMIYVVSHIVDDNKVGQIRGYSFYIKDIIIN